jgi:hypothetical protein
MAIGKQKSRYASRYGNSGDAYKELKKHVVHGVAKFIGEPLVFRMPDL